MGLDFISLAAYQHEAEGVLAHQWMLGNFHEHHILIIEDLNLEGLDVTDVRAVIALPLRVEGVDSGLCTVIAMSHQLI